MEGNIFQHRKVISVKKMECFREYKKLKLQEEFLEKTLSSTIKGLKIDFDLVRQIDEDKLKLVSVERHERMRESTMRGVLSVVKELKFLKSILQESDPSVMKNLDLTDYGSRLTRLSKKMEDLKEGKSELEVLTKEEESLDSDLREFERTIFNERSKNSGKNISERKCPTRMDVNDEFTELVARTGHTQGWSDEDHSLFLKMRKKYRSVPQLVNEMKKKRAHLTTEEIVNHESWHKLYTELREKRRREIAEWRSRMSRNGTAKEEVGSADSSVEVTETKKKKKKKMSENHIVEEKSTKKLDAENETKKKMIEEWKAEKVRKSMMDEEQKKRLERMKIEEEKRRRELKRSETRIKLKSYKEERPELSRDENGPIFQRKETSLSSIRLIKAFRDQDERFVQKRLNRLKVSERITVKNSDQKQRDPRSNESSTLFKPTKGWEGKCKRDFNPGVLFGGINYVKDIQRLSAPRDMHIERG